MRQVLAMKEATDVTAQVRSAQADVDDRGRLAEHEVDGGPLEFSRAGDRVYPQPVVRGSVSVSVSAPSVITMADDFDTIEFCRVEQLWSWLEHHHATPPGCG